ncbi:MAG: response regulator [Amphritea sp.]|nr:response regulator [Amphritea sp.]
MRNYYTTGQAAQLLGVCIRTVQLWVENGQIDSWKTNGGHRRLSKESVNALLDSDNTSSDTVSEARTAPRILLVEDSKSDARLLRQFVLTASPDAEIAEAADGYEALIALGRQTPDILITDLQMPNMDGFQMLAAIQQQLGDEKPAILITTAYSETELKQLPAIPDFVSAVLYKPLDLNLFAHQLKTVIATL